MLDNDNRIKSFFMKTSFKLVLLVVVTFFFANVLGAQCPTDGLPGDPGLTPPVSAKINQPYPNPCQGSFKLYLPPGNGDAVVRIYNWYGIVVYQYKQELTQAPQVLDINLPQTEPGRYVVDVNCAGKSARSQLMIRR
jgi:hypothetical protein